MCDASEEQTYGKNTTVKLYEERRIKLHCQGCDLHPLASVGGVATGELKNLSCAASPSASNKHTLDVST